jgi:cobaltochelatase CobT
MSEDTPLDRFRSVLAGTARAVAHEDGVEVAWTADQPAASGHNLRLTMPARTLPAADARLARGQADHFALRLRHHDTALHARNAPGDPAARACYDAVEAVRYETLGAKGYAGIADNLDAALVQRIAADPIARAQSPDEVPLPTALGLLLREHMTGRPVPELAGPAVAMVRDWIESKAGADFDALALSLDDQKAFQSLTLDMLTHLELTRGEPLEPEGDEGDEDDGDTPQDDGEDEDGGSDRPDPSEIAAEPS